MKFNTRLHELYRKNGRVLVIGDYGDYEIRTEIVGRKPETVNYSDKRATAFQLARKYAQLNLLAFNPNIDYHTQDWSGTEWILS